MPLYEFECTKCCAEFEELLSAEFVDRKSPPPCPSCGCNQVKLLVSAGTFRPQGMPKGRGGFKGPACKPSG